MYYIYIYTYIYIYIYTYIVYMYILDQVFPNDRHLRHVTPEDWALISCEP